MKKKIILILVIIIAIILLFPIPMRLKDGGSIEFKALLYSITKYHKLSDNIDDGYLEGIGIEILGVEVFNNLEESSKKNEDNTNNKSEYPPSFFATVVETNAKYIIVQPHEGESELNSSDKFSIGLGENNDAIYPVGTNVKITYDGSIMETYPAKINATNIEIKSVDNFELIFSERKDLGIKTIVSKDETDKYSYNIFSLGGDISIYFGDKEYYLDKNVTGSEIKMFDLRVALLNNKITMEEIIAKANNDLKNNLIEGDMYKDGGSMIYKYDNYTIIKLHTVNGKRDVYIGPTYMTMDHITY